jgi:hypothetical protein
MYCTDTAPYNQMLYVFHVLVEVVRLVSFV